MPPRDEFKKHAEPSSTTVMHASIQQLAAFHLQNVRAALKDLSPKSLIDRLIKNSDPTIHNFMETKLNENAELNYSKYYEFLNAHGIEFRTYYFAQTAAEKAFYDNLCDYELLYSAICENRTLDRTIIAFLEIEFKLAEPLKRQFSTESEIASRTNTRDLSLSELFQISFFSGSRNTPQRSAFANREFLYRYEKELKSLISESKEIISRALVKSSDTESAEFKA